MTIGLTSGRPGTSLQRRMGRLIGVVLVVDVLLILGSTWLAWQSRIAFDIWTTVIDDSVWPVRTSLWIGALWLAFLGAQGAYARRFFGAGPEEFRAVVTASLVTVGAVGLFAYLVQVQLSRGFVVMTFLLGTPLLLAERYAARKILHGVRRHNHLVHRVLAVGEASGIAEVVGVLERESYVGYRVVGACLAEEEEAGDADLPVPVIGSLNDLLDTCTRLGIDTVLVSRGGFETSAALRRITWELEDTPIELVVVPSLTDVASPRIQMRPVAGLPLLHVESPTARQAGGLPKRAFDLLGSLAILTLISPVLLVIALLVKLNDGGPVFFLQERVGRHGERFRMIKFRSMVVDAEAKLAELAEQNEGSGVLFKMKRDPRITRVGGVLRKFSLDELPQLFNVLGGSMSLVGPRPPLPTEVEQYGFDTHRRLAVRPGMTGLWQVSGRSELSWEESVRLDIYYVDNWSLMSDLVIIAKTVKAVVAGSGAY